MKRRGATGERRTNAVRRRAKAKAHPLREAAGPRRSSAAGLERELKETRDQLAATSEVLRVISGSAFDLQTVLDTVTKSSARLCRADRAFFFRLDGELLRPAATDNVADEVKTWFARNPIRRGRASFVGRAALERRTIHIRDVLADPDYKFPAKAVETYRTFLAVPVVKGEVLLGVIALYHPKVKPFTDKQIALVEAFAGQAAIAIENTRLFEAEQQRSRELAESLEQQTATAKVLDVISRSAFDLRVVFATVVESSVRLCGADRAFIFRFDGQLLHVVATYNAKPEFVEWVTKHPIRPGRHSAAARAALERRTIHIPDALADPDYTYGTGEKNVEAFRTLLGMPILKGEELLGVVVIYHLEVRPFTAKQMALVETFADQAAIAIENVRLFEAEQQRSRELAELLEQQTATSEVLQIISSSPGDLDPVFAMMLEKAARICGATFGNIYRWDGEALHYVAGHNTPPEFAAARKRSPFARDAIGVVGRMLATRAPVHIADLAAEPGYAERRPAAIEAVELGGVRTILAVPMLKDGELIGSFTLYRQEVRPFSDKQVALVTSFAAQAVIAIENTRLLTELRQRTDELGRSVGELRALGEVSQAVNSTLDLETVLETIVTKAAQLSNTDAGAIYVFDEADGEFRLRATYAMDRELIEALGRARIGLDERNVAQMLAKREPVQVADFERDVRSDVDEIILRAGYRARLTAPLFRGDEVVGLLVVRRRTPGAFSENTIDLIKTFAAQSAVAIQNARLFANVETRTRELARSLQDLRTAQDRLIQTEKLASLGQLTAGIAHEIKNPLNFVNNFSGVSVELIDELKDTLGRVKVDDQTRADITELADTLRNNLDKIVQHGKRADSIVKNMLLHSREGSGEHRSVDVNALVEEAVNLAYHGARAEKKGFNITLERSFDPNAGAANLFPQEITRVLLNVIANGFYAAIKREEQAHGDRREPTLFATTKSLGDRVEIRIRDNGTGIPAEVREKMFNPFFTTKPAGEGTGLGLSISHDIVVKQHAGSIEVDSEPGEYTEVRIVLPRHAASKERRAPIGEDR